MVLVRDTNYMIHELGYPINGNPHKLMSDKEPEKIDHTKPDDHYKDSDVLNDFGLETIQFVRSVLEPLGYSKDTVSAAYRVVADASRNSYQHAHNNNPRIPINMVAAIFHDGSVAFQVQDNGNGFDLERTLITYERKCQIDKIMRVEKLEKYIITDVSGLSGYIGQVAVDTSIKHMEQVKVEVPNGGQGMNLFTEAEKENGFEITYDNGGTLFNLLIRRDPFCRLPQYKKLSNVA